MIHLYPPTAVCHGPEEVRDITKARDVPHKSLKRKGREKRKKHYKKAQLSSKYDLPVEGILEDQYHLN